MGSQLLSALILIGVFITTAKARSQPLIRPCLNDMGERALTWKSCPSTCCTEHCTCHTLEGHEFALCNTMCGLIDLRPGCKLQEPISNATHTLCCRVDCSEEVPLVVVRPM